MGDTTDPQYGSISRIIVSVKRGIQLASACTASSRYRHVYAKLIAAEIDDGPFFGQFGEVVFLPAEFWWKPVSGEACTVATDSEAKVHRVDEMFKIQSSKRSKIRVRLIHHTPAIASLSTYQSELDSMRLTQRHVVITTAVHIVCMLHQPTSFGLLRIYIPSLTAQPLESPDQPYAGSVNCRVRGSV